MAGPGADEVDPLFLCYFPEDGKMVQNDQTKAADAAASGYVLHNGSVVLDLVDLPAQFHGARRLGHIHGEALADQARGISGDGVPGQLGKAAAPDLIILVGRTAFGVIEGLLYIAVDSSQCACLPGHRVLVVVDDRLGRGDGGLDLVVLGFHIFPVFPLCCLIGVHPLQHAFVGPLQCLTV